METINTTASQPGNPVKIVHVIGATIAGGAEMFVCDLSIALVKEGYSVTVMAISNRVDSAGEKIRVRMNSEGVNFAAPPSVQVGLGAVKWYARQLSTINPDIVHLHTPNTEKMHFLSVLFGRPSPRIFRTVHNTRLPESPLIRAAFFMNRAVCSIGCGAATLQNHKYSGDNKVVPNGIEFSWPVQNNQIKSAARQKLGLTQNKMVYLSVGSMEGPDLESSQKAHDILITAWKNARMGDNNSELVLIGDGSLRSELEGLAAGDPAITFLGIRPDVKDWLLAADFFTMPSRYEGLPISGIEAVGTGLKCIFSDIAPLRELDAPVCFWSKMGDSIDLAGCLGRTLLDDSPMPEQAVMALRERFGIEGTARQYAAEYQKVT